jgi:DNA-binding NtrC family response regulator
VILTETTEDTELRSARNSSGPTSCGILWIQDGPPGIHFTPFSGTLTLGRTSDADVVLPSPRISRRHAKLSRREGTISLEDLDSRNGTFINGVRATSAPLEHGDLVRLGSSLGLIWNTPGDPPEPFGLIEEPLYGGATLRRAVRHLSMVARSPLSVCLVGPTGTGKEALSRALHRASGRKGELVAVNCATIPEQLAEAQLFGHKRGSFTGAATSEPGYFKVAEGGTLFLDEVVELPLDVQAKLLRATQEDEYTPVGESRPVRAHVRIVVASQAPLDEAVRRGRFRQDLAARLDGFQFRLPPLAQRREDIPLLFRRFLAEALGRPAPPLSARFVEALCLYGWPSNVRELGNAARQVAVLGSSMSELGLELLPEKVARGQTEESDLPLAQHPSLAPTDAASPEWEEFRAALQREKGNVRKAAEAVGISRGRAYRLLASHGENADELRKLIKG